MHVDNRNALVAVLLLASKDPTSINEAFDNIADFFQKSPGSPVDSSFQPGHSMPFGGPLSTFGGIN